MDYLTVKGGKRLGGVIDIHGSKNSALPILAASVILNGEAVIHNCPRLTDVENTVLILKYLGASVKREGKTLIVNPKGVNKNDIPEKLMREMRSSVLFLGALCSKMNSACVYLPGGCEIGLRPIDLHLKALTELSGVISFDGSNICCNAEKMKAGKAVLPFPSVGATENTILASVTLSGKTTLINAAREPEIIDLCRFLNSAGAKISGAGTSVIEIEGVKTLGEAEHTVIPDRIIASTMMCASAITSSELKIRNAVLPQLEALFPVFMSAGCELYLEKNAVTLKPPKRLKRVKKITTAPYPGFPTDSQATVCAMLSVARGCSIINETVFENRFKHIPELCRFGADIEINSATAVINGVEALHGTCAECTDLRGGAALVIAALAAEGESKIKNIYHLDRGYENIEAQLASVGADIKRIKDEEEQQAQKGS